MRSWDDYFWPGTTVLANKLGITDAGKLAAAEHVLTTAAVRDILDGVIEIPHTFDAAHLQALHQHVFGEVYDWAGEFRQVPMSKDGVAFADVNRIPVYLRDAERVVKEVPWPQLSAEEFADQAARVYANINFAHGFREGNGRWGNCSSPSSLKRLRTPSTSRRSTRGYGTSSPGFRFPTSVSTRPTTTSSPQSSRAS